MGVRTIEESLGVEGKFFNSRAGIIQVVTHPECINAVTLDLMEAITSIRARGKANPHHGCVWLQLKDAGHVLKGFWHIGTHSKSANMSALDPAMGRWVTMLGRSPSGRCQGHLPERCTQLPCHCYDMYRWTPSVCHVHGAWFTGWHQCKALIAVPSTCARSTWGRICSTV